MSQNIVAYSFVSEHSKHFFVKLRKNLAFLSGGGGRPLAGVRLEFKFFFTCSLSLLNDTHFTEKNLDCLSVYLKLRRSHHPPSFSCPFSQPP